MYPNGEPRLHIRCEELERKKNRDSYKTISKYLLNTHKPENIKHIFLNRESQFLILNFISIIVEYILELRT